MSATVTPPVRGSWTRPYAPPSSALPCPKCGAGGDVIDSRATAGGGRRRRRACKACAHEWITIELPEGDTRATQALNDVAAALAKMRAELDRLARVIDRAKA